ncbi:MAG: hypothetical protein J6S97_01580 [Bacteroidales bacterium]|nr:hypothetical protein [Bacteroidales bacterium]
MSAINDLIEQIPNPELRFKIRQEVDRMSKQKKFGLVFEEHLPECTPLYDHPVKKGSIVARKAGKVIDNFVVKSIVDGIFSYNRNSDDNPWQIYIYSARRTAKLNSQ